MARIAHLGNFHGLYVRSDERGSSERSRLYLNANIIYEIRNAAMGHIIDSQIYFKKYKPGTATFYIQVLRLGIKPIDVTGFSGATFGAQQTTLGVLSQE
ncbi:hypothetical protein MMC17_008102 [Xylographa soralifera]|nr:hypothetical protein [Xylographa soralifera]